MKVNMELRSRLRTNHLGNRMAQHLKLNLKDEIDVVDRKGIILLGVHMKKRYVMNGKGSI